jgi:hypothetical protein
MQLTCFQNKTPAQAEVSSLLPGFFFFLHLPLLLWIGAGLAIAALPNLAAASALVAFTHELPPERDMSGIEYNGGPIIKGKPEIAKTRGRSTGPSDRTAELAC